MLADWCRCKLQRDIERRGAKSSRTDESSSPSSSLLSTSVPSHLPLSIGHRNRVPEYESGSFFNPVVRVTVLSSLVL